MAFPDERDRSLIRRAEQVENLAIEPVRLAFGVQSRPQDRTSCPSPRATCSRCCSFAARRAACTSRRGCRWRPRCTGRRRWARACSWARCSSRTATPTAPWAATRHSGEPAYFRYLSFDNDLNPQCGSNEATALVTRFTTKDRIADSVVAEYPVMVKALTRDGMAAGAGPRLSRRVQNARPSLAAGRTGGAVRGAGPRASRATRSIAAGGWTCWTRFPTCGTSIAAAFPAKEAVLNGLLSRYPLDEEGYVAAAAALFWDNWNR